MSHHCNQLRNILVVNVNWLGDVVFSVPVFKALRQRYPESRISCLSVPGVKDLLSCVPQIDDVLVYDEKGRDRGFVAKMRLVRDLRRKKFDAVFLLHGSWTRAVLMFLSGIPIRAGYPGKKKGQKLTHPAVVLPAESHKADIYANVVASFGIPVRDPSPELHVPPLARKETARILEDSGLPPEKRFIVVHTSGNWNLKRWPKDSWAELIRRIKIGFDVEVVISEGPRDLEWALEIARQSAVNPVVLAGKTTIPQLLALLERALCVVSGDSGPLHVASCVSKRIIGIYGPTTPLTTGPRGGAKTVILHHDVGCNKSSCYFLSCPENICMKAVSVGEVLERIQASIVDDRLSA